ncbi:pyruvate dehydrogenase [Roseibacterium sp. SDUM158016]|uniref:biotin/lipoyl-containing protein n=1 Tax=Roseicyclus sediminis TaxID=2980997 RepID=UPI0021D25CDB|nr:biotin/lipoyl-containing protein [Roseibacterium sp. SDUM158016]MCU4654286.1 pyruvate dehydrogenase [Roseibacterium sp. SDUM158016]
MPHDVTMPQLGMAQDAGKIVSWLKSPGDEVAKGDALFEVETDKAVMEVESPANGFLTGVAYAAGDDVPVGQVIARISDSADDDAEPEAQAPEAAAGQADDLPEGHAVTMPQLGMAQDSGLLVNWLKSPGEEVAADDILFEVETDKSTMEVEAGRKGWLAATLAEAGEEVPVGDPVAIIAEAKPEAPVARSVKDGGARPAPAAPVPAEKNTAAAPAKPAAAAPAPKPPSAGGGRILASPKARRLALEQGLDLNRLAKAGHPQPFHVADLEALRKMPAAAAATAPSEAPRRLTATCAEDGLSEFVPWAAETRGLTPDTILAGLAGASLAADGTVTVSVESLGTERRFAVPPGRSLSAVAETEDAPALIVRDLRGTPISTVALGAEEAPVLTIARDGAGLSITLECAARALDPGEAIRLLTDFAGRMEHPLRHLL